MAYATLDDLAEYLGTSELDENAQRLLEDASLFIEMCTLGRIDPTNERQMRMVKLAVCAQVEYWQETGDHVGALGTYGSMSLGSFSMSRGTGSSSSHLQLAPLAYQALFMEGLLYRGVDTK